MTSTILNSTVSRRDALRGASVLGGGAALGSLPFSSLAFAKGDPAAQWPGVARFIRSYVDQRKVSGMVAALGFAEAEPAFISAGARMFGNSGSVGPDTLYRIYSMTKPVTGMATMICIDDGLIGLDQPLHEILPAFRNMRVQKVYDGPITADNLEPAARPITIRHLLTHTAGLGYASVSQNGPLSDAYTRRGLLPGAVSNMELVKSFFGGETTDSLADFADGLAEMPLVYQPGTRWSYSVATDLLGRVIEVVSGQPFDQYMQDRILTPCGMTSTGFRVAREDAGRLTANYFLLGGMPVPIDLPNSSVFLDEPAFPFGGAGLVSTARDYDRFLQMIAGRGEIGGHRVMSEAAVQLGTSDLFPETLAPNGGFSNGERSFGFGAAGLVGRGDAAGLFGWFGAAGTVGLVNTTYGLRQTLMTQYMPAENYDIQGRFPQVVAEDAMRMLAS
ncbi:beta-lactamase [Aurantiacibacter atlanticus]|uniref:Beta-lactamase n=1 Tax=Aurantiacibacter atlanticus TaxID=1648404 RepID=A0A0H4VXG9_9SPHN|nr:serine hydrolase domain-containing protein [Aurantiacibacter atlanticus]AKQ41793.1 beta-lactamase [Aurantiacibacter atlanticus]MDF1833737.1 serine hydrolase [Alteraurantiacibacter sp. bin_em_oilr2.035]